MGNNDQLYSIKELEEAPRCTYVEAFTERNIFRGYTTHAISERFLDILNNGSIVNKSTLANDFLPLTEVEIFDMNGKKVEVTPNCLLNKSNILVVAECRITQGELPPAKPFLYTLFQRKQSIWVNIQIQDLTINGQVHVNQNETSIQDLEIEGGFLPVTQATIASKLNCSDSEYDFLAVNKNQIISITERSKI
jgi:hypothetical protein